MVFSGSLIIYCTSDSLTIQYLQVDILMRSAGNTMDSGRVLPKLSRLCIEFATAPAVPGPDR